jgi:hypothetical protein
LIRECPARANVPDLFKGDEVSNAARLSLVKVQMFYFTLTLVFAYGVQLVSCPWTGRASSKTCQR